MTDETAMSQKESGAVYVCERHPGFFFRLNGKRFNFEKHQLKVDNPEDMKAIDELLKENPVFAQKIKKVDVAAAEALVAKHQREHGGAVSGPFSSDMMAKMEANRLTARDEQFNRMDNAEEVKTALEEESNLKITHKANISKSETSAETSEQVATPKPNSLKLSK